MADDFSDYSLWGLYPYGAFAAAPASFDAFTPQPPIPSSWSVADLLSPPQSGTTPIYGGSNNSTGNYSEGPSPFNGALPPYGALAAAPTSFDEYAWQIFNQGTPPGAAPAPSLAPSLNNADPWAAFLEVPSSFNGGLPPYSAFANAPTSFEEPAQRLPIDTQPVPTRTCSRAFTPRR